MKTLITAFVTIAMFAATQAAVAIDINNGKSLQQENCMGCHDDGVYSREDRRVTSSDALRAQVQRCETNLNLQWFPEDVDAVIEYLNTSFYKFQ
ncbi:MAG: cytochrome c [Gammaproteobacteria bacterium]|nr:cytochrome c [Gammaproteobacteria bacterium]